MQVIVVVGLGYVGIPLATLFATLPEFKVYGLQRRSPRSEWKIDYLNEGKCPIGGNEPELPELIQKVVAEKKLEATSDFDVCGKADAILIAVQTPVDNESHKPQYDSLENVVREVGYRIKSDTLVCIESTVAPGTTTNIIKPLLESSTNGKLVIGNDLFLAFTYERVMVGRLLHNLRYYPRIIGGVEPESTRRAVELYSRITKAPIYETDALTAEVAKVVENAYRDVNIAFANEVAMICEALGVDVFKVRELVNSLPNDPSDELRNPFRHMHYPGAGVGGHCLPKDSWLLKYGLDTYGRFRYDAKLITTSREINNSMPLHMLELIELGLKKVGKKIEASRIAILGLAFTAESDDIRNSPSITLIDMLKAKGAVVKVHDPYVDTKYFAEVSNQLESVIADTDCLVIMTAHKCYYNLDLQKLKSAMNVKQPVLVDGRNVMDRNSVLDQNIIYLGIGKNYHYLLT